MPKRAVAPRGFYTASEVLKMLGIGNSTLYHLVEIGKIKRVVPPGRRDGYYIKSDIDRMVRDKEVFLLSYASEPTSFRKATEEDIRGINDLSISLHGHNSTTPYDTMLSWFKQNPETYYITEIQGIITGYIGFLYLNKVVTESIMQTEQPGRPQPDASKVLPFEPNNPIHGLFVGLGVRPDLSLKQSRSQGYQLITGGMDILENLAKRGSPVKKLYATSMTQDGIRLSREMGFKEIIYPGEPLIRYELDLETAMSPLAIRYREDIRNLQKPA